MKVRIIATIETNDNWHNAFELGNLSGVIAKTIVRTIPDVLARYGTSFQETVYDGQEKPIGDVEVIVQDC